MSPPLSTRDVTKGYLLVPAEYLEVHPDFTLAIDLKPRLITPHPLTNQQTLTIARGPIIYCVEDVDNEWVSDHFRSTYVDPRCLARNVVVEQEIADARWPDEKYIGITVKEAAYLVDFDKLSVDAFVEKEALNKTIETAELIEKLKFVPYYYRANRGGRGMARVGLRQWMW